MFFFFLMACTEDADKDGYKDGVDCDDTNPDIHPEAVEVCDGVDNDCDGEVDDEDADFDAGAVFYEDADGDGFGSEIGHLCPDRSTGVVYVDNADDCDDTRDWVNPDQVEVCDGRDNDCDGIADGPDSADAITHFDDADGDGFGTGEPDVACGDPIPGETSSTPGDCDDEDPEIHPDAVEICDGFDNDCDGVGEEDGDLDGWLACEGDCDDTDPDVAPDADEICGNGIDDDCVDGDFSGVRYYPDLDGDGFGTAMGFDSCDVPTDASLLDGDCDDEDDAISPAAVEVCVNGVDEDCSGVPDDGCPVEHCGLITEDEVWGPQVHIITCDVSVGNLFNDPTLTIEDGAEVRFTSGTSLFVGNSAGRMLVQGTGGGVVFGSHASSPEPGDWGSLVFGASDSGSVLVGATIEHGGGGTVASLIADSPVRMEGITVRLSLTDGASIDAPADISNSAFELNGGTGLVLESTDPPFAFDGNQFDGNGAFAALVHLGQVPAIGASSTFGGTASSVGVRGGAVQNSLTWPGISVPYTLLGTVVVSSGADWTLEGPMDVEVEPDEEIAVTGHFTTDAGVELRGRSGSWGGVEVSGPDAVGVVNGVVLRDAGLVVWNGGTLRVEDSELLGGGSLGIDAFGTGLLSVQDSTVSGYDGDGVLVRDFASLIGSFSGNTIENNNGAAVRLAASEVGQLDASSTFVGNTEPVVVGAGVVEDSVTWAAVDSGYRIEAPVRVEGASDPVLTLAPGSDLEFALAGSLGVGVFSPGGLSAIGGAAGVTLRGSGTAGDWTGLRIGESASEVTLDGVSILDAGANGNPCLSVAGGEVQLTGGAVRNCLSTAVDVFGSASLGLTGSTIGEAPLGVRIAPSVSIGTSGFAGNTFTNLEEPLQVAPRHLASLDASSFGGNDVNAVIVSPGGLVDASGTWGPVGAPYLVRGSISIGGSASVTIDSGVEMLFEAGQRLSAGTSSPGGLVADGASFASAQDSPAAGDWPGLVFGSQCSGVALTNIEVLHAGQNPPSIAAVHFNGCGGSISDSTIGDSAEYGVYVTAGSGASVDEATIDCVGVAAECVEQE